MSGHKMRTSTFMPSRSFSFTGVPSSPVAETAETLLFRGGIVDLVYGKVVCRSGLRERGDSKGGGRGSWCLAMDFQSSGLFTLLAYLGELGLQTSSRIFRVEVVRLPSAKI